MTALCCFDQMLSGQDLEEISKRIKKKHTNILTHLINFVSSLDCDDNDANYNGKYDNYIYQTFKCFCKNKLEIIIHFLWLNQDYVDSDIRSLIIPSLEHKHFDCNSSSPPSNKSQTNF